MQMGVDAGLMQIGEDHDQHHMSTSTIWLNRRRTSASSCKGVANTGSNHYENKSYGCGSDKKAISDHHAAAGDASKKETKKQQLLCLCAPTTHAGSFKCRLHRATTSTPNAHSKHPPPSPSSKTSIKKCFSSKNLLVFPAGGGTNLDVQTLPRLSRFGRSVVPAASDGGPAVAI